jgi:D-beta-D-heptose 7-phosphate kinase/D-beta-D-heptose 1-phosphate adenosyltransferase
MNDLTVVGLEDAATLAFRADRFAGANVWVIGDLMLDEYVVGAVERISPEAPVPVVRVRDTQSRLGGAANVARQLAVLGANVSLAGVVGEDAAGENLRALCAAASIDTRAMLALRERCTTRKLRVLGATQQLIRMDWEAPHACPSLVGAELLARLKRGTPPDVLILSDYAKGVLTPELIESVLVDRDHDRLPVLVDPKHRDYRRYRGASVVTPNLRELEVACGETLDVDDMAGIVAAARRVVTLADLGAMVVTLGARGMLVVPNGGAEVAIPAVERAVYDVTGAGDTAIAVLAIALATEAPLVAAAQIANTAAGVAVGQVGAAAVDLDSIKAALGTQPTGKIMRRDELAARAASWRLLGKRIVFTNGCFDLLHSGHLALLEQSARLGDVLVLAINSDASVQRLKGPTRPLVSQEERAQLLAALSCVDAVTIFEEDTPLATLERVRPHVLVKGGDYQLDQVVGREFVEASGGRVALVPLIAERSTSALVARIRERA